MELIIIISLILFIFYKYFTKDNLSELPEIIKQEIHTGLSKEDLISAFKEIRGTAFSTGPLENGANISENQNKYDLLFKDVLVSSEKRNAEKYPNPNKYSIDLNINIDKIYKAELIEVYIPTATDTIINVQPGCNRLYFRYTNYHEDFTALTTDGYIIIQPGYYISPEVLATELTRQFFIVLSSAGFVVSKTVGVTVEYNKNLNRFIFKDRSFNIDAEYLPTLVLYPKNGYVINMELVVENSMGNVLLLNNQLHNSGPKMINNGVIAGTDYGEFLDASGNISDVPLNVDSQFSNCIISGIVLTQCKIFLSLGKLNGTTCNIVPDESGKDNNVPLVFCQIPVNSATILGASSNLVQFYNPPISKVNRLDVRWYSDDGKLVKIQDQCFTIRIHYFQKRLDTTDFSYPIP